MTATTRQALDRVLREYGLDPGTWHRDTALLDALVAALPDPAAEVAALDAVLLGRAYANVSDDDGFGYDDAMAGRLLAREYGRLAALATEGEPT